MPYIANVKSYNKSIVQIQSSNKIHGLTIIQPDVFYDFRGAFVETFSAEKYQFKDGDGNPIKFIEDDISISRRHVVRGLHGDTKTWKLVQCLAGEIYYVVADMRKESPTYLNWEAFSLNETNKIQLLVPAGCVNGFLVMSENSIFSYKQNQHYSGQEKQITVRWNDPALNIFWPVSQPILSQRDAMAKDIDIQ